MHNSNKTIGSLLVFLGICLFCRTAGAKYGGGSGRPDDPYLIYTAQQMNTIGNDANDWDKHFILMEDIDLSNYKGTSFNIIEDFSGVFDGNGHTISNFSYSTDSKRVGLFRNVSGEDAVVKDLGLIGPNVDAKRATTRYVGSLVGRLNLGTITGCYVQGGSVNGEGNVGGLVGEDNGLITNCYVQGGSVTGNERVGGLVGHHGEGRITNCYSTASVRGNSSVGGLLGANDGTVCFSYWDNETSGQSTSAGGMGKTTAEMQTASTFVIWGYELIWTIDNGADYPRLAWEDMPGETINTLCYGGGSGGPNNPYLIYTALQMNLIGAEHKVWDKHFKLMADIDLSGYKGTSFNIIGYDEGWDDYKPFIGVFDGNGHTISNFSYTSSTAIPYDIGLFRVVDGPNAEIKNLGLINPNVDAGTGRYVGSLVGGLDDGTITNCYVEGGSVSGDIYIGGLVGFNRGSHMYGFNLGKIYNCYSSTRVSGRKYVGGLVGGISGTITNCYSSGIVTGTKLVGGLVGRNIIVYYEDANWPPSPVTNSFWDIQTSGQTTSAGGTGKTTAEMQMASTFIGWWSENTWTIDEGIDYPRLAWENMPGEYIPNPFEGGDGTVTNPYLIRTGEQLNMINLATLDLDKHFQLVEDIDLSGYTGTDFNIIGYSVDWNRRDNKPFTGVFDGNGHTISNFSYTSYTEIRNKIGLFGIVNGPNAEIKNLGLLNPNVVVVTGDDVGSLVGCLSDGTISNCYVDGGSVSVAGGWSVGGLVGYSDSDNTIANSYSSASISGSQYVGGLVGCCWSVISNCYSAGSVSGRQYFGALVGYGDIWCVTSSFWDIQTSRQTMSAGGIGKTTAEMQMASTFLDAGWDFVNETENGTEDIWWILEGQDYPRLSREPSPTPLPPAPPPPLPPAINPLSEALDTYLSFTTGGSADWFSQTMTSYYDGDGAQSGNISHDQESWMQTTVNGSGEVRFYWKVSSEEDFDFLEFYIDGSLQEEVSGLEGWEQETYEITDSGVHTLEWRYVKDKGTDSDSDCGWVDKVEWVPN